MMIKLSDCRLTSLYLPSLSPLHGAPAVWDARCELTLPPPPRPCARSKVVAKRQAKRNPLRNVHAMLRLNPYAAVVKQAALGDEKKAVELKAARAEKAKVGVRLGSARLGSLGFWGGGGQGTAN